MIVSAAADAGVDVEYTFGQIGIETPVVDWGGNCGNLTFAVGVFALERELVTADITDDGRARSRAQEREHRHRDRAVDPRRCGRSATVCGRVPRRGRPVRPGSHPVAVSLPRRVDDRRHVPDDGNATTVENTEPSYTDLTVADATGIEAGDSFSVVDVKTGDRTAVPASAEVRRVDGEYEVSATDDVDFKPPKGGSKG